MIISLIDDAAHWLFVRQCHPAQTDSRALLLLEFTSKISITIALKKGLLMQTFARFALVFSLAGPIALIDAQAFEKKLKREIEEKKNTPEKKERKLPSKRPPRRSIRPEGLGTLETNAEKAEKTEAETKSDLTNEPEKRPSLIPDAKPIAEKLFTLQAVEFLTLDLAAENRSFPELKAALAYHRVVYDKLRRQAGDTDDEACREAIAFYDKRLKSIELLTNEFYTSICRDNEAIRKQIDQTQRTALLNGLMFGLDRSAKGASDADSFVTGMAAAAVTIENESPKVAKARKRAQASQAQAIKSFHEDFDKEAKGASDDFSKLANSPDWKSAPFLLRQPKPEENPFAVFKTINKIGDATSKELITHATTVAQAAKRVPLPEAFHPFRVLFLAQAGDSRIEPPLLNLEQRLCQNLRASPFRAGSWRRKSGINIWSIKRLKRKLVMMCCGRWR